MKKLLPVALLLASSSLYAQLKLPVLKSASSIKGDLEKVIRDYSQNFNNIKGDTLRNSGNTVEFSSKVVVNGALETTITQYQTPNTYSWQTTLFQTEKYEEAVSKYRQLFRQLNGSVFTLHDRSSMKLKGSYDTPDESRAFASSVLESDGTYMDEQAFKIEIALNYSFPEWKVRIMIYEKVSDQNIRPTVY